MSTIDLRCRASAGGPALVRVAVYEVLLLDFDVIGNPTCGDKTAAQSIARRQVAASIGQDDLGSRPSPDR